MAENDTRTCRTRLLREAAPDICPAGSWYDGGVWNGPPDMDTSVALLWNNVARMLAYGYGGWWFDMWGGWFDAPELMQVLRKAQALVSRYPPRQIAGTTPAVCVIIDEELPDRDPAFGKLCEPIYRNAMSLGKSGTPYALYLRSDLGSVSLNEFRAIWFLGIAKLTGAEMAVLNGAECDENRAALWTHLSGTERWSASAGQWEQFAEPGPVAPENLRALWKSAGAHVYCESDDVLYAGHGWLSLHTVKGGMRHVRLPFRSTVRDAISGTSVADDADSFDFVMDRVSTSLFRFEPVL